MFACRTRVHVRPCCNRLYSPRFFATLFDSYRALHGLSVTTAPRARTRARANPWLRDKKFYYQPNGRLV